MLMKTKPGEPVGGVIVSASYDSKIILLIDLSRKSKTRNFEQIKLLLTIRLVEKFLK